MFMTLELWFQIKAFIAQWYWLPISLGYVFVLSTILIENRNPTKTVAWLLVIVFLPVFGILIYFFFGQKFNKIKKFNRNEKIERHILTKYWNKNNDLIQQRINTVKQDIGPIADVFQFLNNQHISPVTSNNKVQLLTNGEEKFKHLFNDLKHAKHHIHVEYYIFKDDSIGNQFIDILIEQRKKGIQIRVILDDFGSSTKKIKKRLLENDIEFHLFLPVTFNSLANSNYRDHRKIVIIDGEIGYVGGINVADKYINTANSDLYWRDTALKINGNATSILQLYFWNNWNLDDSKTNYLNEAYFPMGDLFTKENDEEKQLTDISFTFSNPGYDSPYAMDSIILAIYKATKSIKICTPYFIPSEQLNTALETAAMRGVSVEIILPKNSDSKIVQLASISFTKPLLKKGVQIYLYNKGFLHAKTILIDDVMSFIGTINLDTRSFYLNFEIAAIVADRELGKQMAKQFELDKKNSDLLTLHKYLKKGKLYRSAASICRLLSPVL